MNVHHLESIDPAALALPPTESVDITPFQKDPGH